MAKVTVIPKSDAYAKSARSGPNAASFEASHCDQLPYFPQTDEPLQMFRIDYEPDIDVPSHAHTRDEIIYVLEGQLILGARTLEAGDALFVAKDTLYGFKTGPEGASFLNFRATSDVGIIRKEEFLEYRKQKQAAQG